MSPAWPPAMVSAFRVVWSEPVPGGWMDGSLTLSSSSPMMSCGVLSAPPPWIAAIAPPPAVRVAAAHSSAVRALTR